MRTARAELLERADQSRVVDELSRVLRHDIDSAQLVNRAAESVGTATGVDRCDVLLVDAHLFSAVHGTWTSSPANADLPRPESFVDLPEALTTLLLEAAQHLATLQIEHVDEDSRLPPEAAAQIIAALGVRALAAVPVSVGDEVVGWLLLQSVLPRAWQSREIAFCEGLSHDLVTSLVQVHAFEQQRESTRRLEELDRAKDAFVSTVSHELRTPLTSIVGYLEMLNDGGLGELDDDASHGVAVIERNVGRLRSLIEDLLTLSAYDTGRVQPDLVTTDLNDVIASCLRTLGPDTAAKSLEMVVVSQPGVTSVLVDRNEIERVVHHLLSNAVKFSHAGEQVIVRVRREEDDVVLDVIDTGTGIPLADQRRLFSRFFRSRLADEEEIQGSGLGLALVQTVVEWHDGTAELASAEGEGTTVTVRLPQAP